MALFSERISHLNGGVFYFRNEDTDDKREIENAAEIMVDGIQRFGIQIDEG
jgi:glutamyl/glutaminyl-tRNA synthetase